METRPPLPVLDSLLSLKPQADPPKRRSSWKMELHTYQHTLLASGSSGIHEPEGFFMICV